MSDFIFLVPICTFLCVGLHALTRRENILGFWSYVVLDKNEENRFALADPISECLLCMSSFYGVVVLSIHYGAELPSIGFWLLVFMIFLFCILEMICRVQGFQALSKLAYLSTLIFFLFESVQNPLIESIAFLICVAGFNQFICLIKEQAISNMERNGIRNRNEVNQSQAIGLITEAIKGIKK